LKDRLYGKLHYGLKKGNKNILFLEKAARGLPYKTGMSTIDKNRLFLLFQFILGVLEKALGLGGILDPHQDAGSAGTHGDRWNHASGIISPDYNLDSMGFQICFRQFGLGALVEGAQADQLVAVIGHCQIPLSKEKLQFLSKKEQHENVILNESRLWSKTTEESHGNQ